LPLFVLQHFIDFGNFSEQAVHLFLGLASPPYVLRLFVSHKRGTINKYVGEEKKG
jgi:hypothetical protein